MQTGWLIYSKQDAQQNKPYIDWFIEEARLQDLLLKLILREELTIGIINNARTIYFKNEIVNKPDFAVVRTIEPLLSTHLEACGVVVFNSSTIARICNDKALTHHHITDLAIPMVNTIFIKKEDMSDQPPMTFPFVIKETTGRGGAQVYLIETPYDWKQCISNLSTNNIIIQSCNVQLGKDIRVFVVGEEIIGAVLRESSEDFRANFKLGGSAYWYELHPKERAVIRKIITYFDFDMVGIDFLIGLNGELLFNEVEDIVGSRTLSAVSDINLLEQYVSHIKWKLLR